jgi:replicative DNA helicase
MVAECKRWAADGADREADPLEYVAEAAASITACAAAETRVDEDKRIDECMLGFAERYESVARGDAKFAPIRTGLRAFDERYGGLKRGTLIVIAARPGHGKTALALGIGAHVARNTGPVQFFSLEMMYDSVAARLAAESIKVSVGELNAMRQTQEIRQRVASLIGRFDGVPLWVDARPALTIEQIRAKCIARKAQCGLALAVIDYIQIVKPSDGRMVREQQVARMVQTAQAMGKELDVPVIVCAQLNREVENAGGRRPRMSDLRETGALENEADVVLFPWRTGAEPSDDTVQDAEIVVGKFRNGPGGGETSVPVGWVGKYTRFVDRC